MLICNDLVFSSVSGRKKNRYNGERKWRLEIVLLLFSSSYYSQDYPYVRTLDQEETKTTTMAQSFLS